MCGWSARAVRLKAQTAIKVMIVSLIVFIPADVIGWSVSVKTGTA
jgi:hypothetical protein